MLDFLRELFKTIPHIEFTDSDKYIKHFARLCDAFDSDDIFEEYATKETLGISNKTAIEITIADIGLEL
jgi:hypothetical protein